MNKIILFSFVILLSAFSGQQSIDEADQILGIWQIGTGKGRIEITRYGDKYGGKIVWLREPLDSNGNPKLDSKNPDVSKRKNTKLGLNNLLGFSYKGKGIYEGGTIYDPDKGKTYKCIMTLENKNTLDVRGYIGASFIGRTDVWHRIK